MPGSDPTAATGRRRSLWLALGVGLGLRLAWCLHAARVPVGLHDPGLYRFIAERLRVGLGYSYANGPTAYYPPGYVFVLAGVGWVVDLVPGIDDPALVATVLVNLAASAAAIALAWRVAGRLGGRRAAAVAAGVLAVWPNLVVHTAVPLTETLTIALVLAIAALAIEGLDGDGPGGRTVVGLGVLLGLAILVRPVLAPMAGALFLVWARSGAGWRTAAIRTAGVVGVAVLVITPWVLRNAEQADTWALTLNNGDNLCIGHQPGADGTFQVTERCFPDGLDDEPRPLSEIHRDATNRQQALEHLRTHLAGEPMQVLRRFWATVGADHDGLRAVESFGEDPFLGSGARDAVRRLSDGGYLVAIGAGVVLVPGALRHGRRGSWMVFALGVATLLAPLATFGEPRFKVPAVPLYAVLLGVGAAAERRATGGDAEPRATGGDATDGEVRPVAAEG